MHVLHFNLSMQTASPQSCVLPRCCFSISCSTVKCVLNFSSSIVVLCCQIDVLLATAGAHNALISSQSNFNKQSSVKCNKHWTLWNSSRC